MNDKLKAIIEAVEARSKIERLAWEEQRIKKSEEAKQRALQAKGIIKPLFENAFLQAAEKGRVDGFDDTIIVSLPAEAINSDNLEGLKAVIQETEYANDIVNVGWSSPYWAFIIKVKRK
jgi:hypothetical protein